MLFDGAGVTLPGAIETDLRAQKQLLCEAVSVDEMNLAEGEERTIAAV